MMMMKKSFIFRRRRNNWIFGALLLSCLFFWLVAAVLQQRLLDDAARGFGIHSNEPFAHHQPFWIPTTTTTRTRTITTITTTTTTTTRNRTVRYLTMNDLRSHKHAYAGAWWMSVSRFRQVNVSHIPTLEDATFRAMDEKQDIRLTRDMMEFHVEHLSKWWKVLFYQHFVTPNQRLLGNLFRYIQGNSFDESSRRRVDLPLPSSATTKTQTIHPANPMRETIAILPYFPIAAATGSKASEQAIRLDVFVLAAQVKSLLRVRVGRIVFVSHQSHLEYIQGLVWPAMMDLLTLSTKQRNDNTKNATQQTWEEWWDNWKAQRSSQHKGKMLPRNTTLGTTELVWAGVANANVDRIPRDALQLAHHAFFFSETSKDKISDPTQMMRAQNSLYWKRIILGTDDDDIAATDRWKYIYYSEPDSPVFVRNYALPQLKQVLDQNRVLFPHRLQPVPHVSDLAEKHDKELTVYDLPPQFMLPRVGNWTKVEELSEEWSCCDQGWGDYPILDHRRYISCGTMWYLCGFGGPPLLAGDALQRFYRLAGYQLMRNTAGTRLTLIAGSEQGRRCIPTRGACG